MTKLLLPDDLDICPDCLNPVEYDEDDVCRCACTVDCPCGCVDPVDCVYASYGSNLLGGFSVVLQVEKLQRDKLSITKNLSSLFLDMDSHNKS